MKQYIVPLGLSLSLMTSGTLAQEEYEPNTESVVYKKTQEITMSHVNTILSIPVSYGKTYHTDQPTTQENIKQNLQKAVNKIFPQLRYENIEMGIEYDALYYNKTIDHIGSLPLGDMDADLSIGLMQAHDQYHFDMPDNHYDEKIAFIRMRVAL